MNRIFLSASPAAVVLLFAASLGFAQEEKTVAFRAKSGEYVSTISNGGLRANGKSITNKQIFYLIDVNGGDLEDNDEIKIKELGGSSKPSYWQESADTLIRTPTADAACIFKVKKNDTKIKLQTASGKFVSVDSRAMVLTSDESGKMTDFELIENPTPEAATPAPAATPTPAPSPTPTPKPARKSSTL